MAAVSSFSICLCTVWTILHLSPSAPIVNGALSLCFAKFLLVLSLSLSFFIFMFFAPLRFLWPHVRLFPCFLRASTHNHSMSFFILSSPTLFFHFTDCFRFLFFFHLHLRVPHQHPFLCSFSLNVLTVTLFNFFLFFFLFEVLLLRTPCLQYVISRSLNVGNFSVSGSHRRSPPRASPKAHLNEVK